MQPQTMKRKGTEGLSSEVSVIDSNVLEVNEAKSEGNFTTNVGMFLNNCMFYINCEM